MLSSTTAPPPRSKIASGGIASRDIEVLVPCTAVLRGALPDIRDQSARSDLLFLERWEMEPEAGMGAALRVQQIRRANPELAAAIRAEIAARKR
jgi:hypothetical protein